jgi:anhydro-N-acetylmuramic acid kinase
MSGTSVDAIDAALVDIDGIGSEARVELRAFTSLPFPSEIRRRIFQLFDPSRGRVDAICTYLPPGCALDQVVAFDTGPGNMVIDALAEVMSGGKERFDRDGRMAARGKVQPRLLAEWLEDPCFAKDPPKTTGRERFGVQFARRAMRSAQAGGISLEDLLATASELTAQSIADSYRRFLLPRGPIDEIIVGGGGSLNPHLRGRLAALLPGISLLRHEDVGIDSRAKEAISIAVIARDSLAGLPTNVPGATGGTPAILGKINL